MWAVAAQNKEIVAAFLSGELCVPPLPNAVDKRRQTALHLAALQGNIEIYKMLLGAGWKENAKDQQTAIPIHLAAGNGHSELIKQFKKALHDINVVDGDGKYEF
jgi:ankyrin repeat protein